jgi:hypothetical protein
LPARQFGQWNRAPPIPADTIQHDSEEPSSAVRATLELMKGAPRRKKRLLYGVFGQTLTSQYAACHPQENLTINQGNSLELLSLVKAKRPHLISPVARIFRDG